MKHIVDSQQFSRNTLEALFKIADSFPIKSKPMRDKVMASLFYEPSTRTRFSFESAMVRLGGHVISTENAAEFSSAAKGETLEDTIRVIQHYADIIVLRHPEQNAAARAAAVSNVPIINGGDGAGQHPTQALLDLYTIKKELGKIDGIHVAFVGDLKHGRTVHSLAYLLGKYKDIRLSMISPKALAVGENLKKYLQNHTTAYKEIEDWDTALSTADVVYQTRIQKERFTTAAEYKRYKGRYIITKEIARSLGKKTIIMHPLPRVDEIALEVDALPQAVYFKQAQYGVWIRMAILQFVLNFTKT